MIWIPLVTLLLALSVADVRRKAGRPANGLFGWGLGVAVAVSAVALVVLLISGLDLGTAERALESLEGAAAAQPGLVTTLLAGAGVVLVVGGSTRLVDRVALSDPDGPLPATFLPGLASVLGLLLLLAAYLRL